MRLFFLAACLWACHGTPIDTDRSQPSAPGDPPEPWVAPDPGDTRAVNDAQFLEAAVLAINAASSRIRIAEYIVYEDGAVDEIIRALSAAAGRGVTVQFLADEEGEQTDDVLYHLGLAENIETRLDNPQVTLHNKLIIADDVVLVGSHNFSGHALRYNHEASTLVHDAEVAAWYATWFNAVWDSQEPVLPRWSRTDLTPVADRMITSTLIDCMNDATVDIDVVMYAISWNALYPGSDVDRVLTTLEAAKSRGLTVRVIVDGSSWIVDNEINDAAIARLTKAQIPVWRASEFSTTHAKVLRCDDTIVVGDANWSYSGLELMHGTSLVVRRPDVVDDYRAWMDEIRSESTPQ